MPGVEEPSNTHSFLILAFFLGTLEHSVFSVQNYVARCGQWAVHGDDVFITFGLRHFRVGMGSPCSFSPTVTRTNNMNQSVSFFD